MRYERFMKAFPNVRGVVAFMGKRHKGVYTYSRVKAMMLVTYCDGAQDITAIIKKSRCTNGEYLCRSEVAIDGGFFEKTMEDIPAENIMEELPDDMVSEFVKRLSSHDYMHLKCLRDEKGTVLVLGLQIMSDEIHPDAKSIKG